MDNKVIKLEASFEKKTYVYKDTGESFDYYAVSVLIDGQFVKLSVPKESRPLLNYLLDNYK